ncbi:RagB/SusD family nutrient uptake outer membrane protein [Prolixibacteraceae bacterium JC049]|nr:RagB/SusD family nutrient uptake outer membrane protein [Prolixibacteraceae bacterium JC049]
MKLYKSIIYTLTACFLLSSCNDYLDKLPDNRTSLNSAESIGLLLVNAYPKGGYTSLCEVMSDNAGEKGPSAYIETLINKDQYTYKEVFSSKYQGSPDYYWTSCYNAIAHANQALDAIEENGDGEELNSYKAEALLARAYSHFMLVNLFAKPYNKATAASDLGIPYVKEVENVLLKEYKRNTVKEVYDFIEADLTAGFNLIDDTRYSVPKYHFNSAAAAAFAARFYLWRNASDEDLQKSVSFASKVFTGDVASSLRDWNGYYSVKSYYDKKAQYTKAVEKPNLLLVETTDPWGYYYAAIRYSLSVDKYREIFLSSNVKGLELAYGVHGNDKSANVPKYQLYKIKDNPSSTSFYAAYMNVLLSTDEALFNRIEANAQLNNISEAITDINFLLQKIVEKYNPAIHTVTASDITKFYSNTTSEKEAIVKFVLDIKRKHFIHEGMRWFDVRRHGITVTHQVTGEEPVVLKADDPRRLLQIPEDAIANGLTPNKR